MACSLKALEFDIHVKTNNGKLTKVKTTNIQEIESALRNVKRLGRKAFKSKHQKRAGIG